MSDARHWQGVHTATHIIGLPEGRRTDSTGMPEAPAWRGLLLNELRMLNP
jgi:hypothetical protein